MSKYGSRTSQKGFRYKSEDFPEEESAETMPDIRFNNEIILNVGEICEGDITCSTKVLKDDEEVPEGSFGSYIPQGRPNLVEIMESMNKKMDFFLQENEDSRKRIAELEDQEEIYKKAFMPSKLIEVANLTVQLYDSFETKLINSKIPEKFSFPIEGLEFRSRNLEIIFPDKAKLINFRSLKAYRDLSEISKRDSVFRSIRERRNIFIHPESVKVEHVKDCLKYIGDGKTLGPEHLILLRDVKEVIDLLINFEQNYPFLFESK